MSNAQERLYALLPAVYRLRDSDQGEPLRALMAVFEKQLRAIEADIETTWDNWFIETCEDWLVPYLGDTVGARGLRSLDAADFSLRGYVANALADRRRKGTAAATELLARDVTGYPCRAVELFSLTATTMHVNHVREPQVMLGTADLGDAGSVQHVGTAFDPFAHTADVRPVDTGQVRYNLPNLALFLWRIQTFELSRVTARAMAGETGWYHLDPRGINVPTFSVQRSEEDITTLAQPEHVPHPLTRLELIERDPADDPPIVVRTEAAGAKKDLTLKVCHLADVGGALPSHRPDPGVAGVDPELGRLVLNLDDVPPNAAEPFEVLVDYLHGFPGRVGAGPFDRSDAWASQLGQSVVQRQWGVSRSDSAVGTETIVATLEEAVVAWNTFVGGLAMADRSSAVGLITITDSRTYDAPTTAISLPDGARLYVLAALWAESEEDGVPVRTVGDVIANQVRPHLRGDLVVSGSRASQAARTGGLWLNGLLLDGEVRVEPGDLQRLCLAHCTQLPDHGGIRIESSAGDANASLEIELDACMVGALSADDVTERCSISNSAVFSSGRAVDLPGAAVEIDSSTTYGGIACRTLDASDSILDEGKLDAEFALDVEHRQNGCIRFSYVPHGASSPRRYRCQPDLALEGVTEPADRRRVVSRLRPRFGSEEMTDPAFALLAFGGADELKTTSSDGSEPGVWNHLQHALRLANLQAALRQYLRFGLEAGPILDR